MACTGAGGPTKAVKKKHAKTELFTVGLSDLRKGVKNNTEASKNI
jgi:hypothetical protein